MKWNPLVAALLLLAVAAMPASLHAAPTPEELAKLAQNPITNLISVPLQNNTNFNVGPQSGTQNLLNIQPVIPVRLSKDWNLITRTILPVLTQPGFLPGQGSTTGLGDIQFSAFASPADAGGSSGARVPSCRCRQTATTASAMTVGAWGRRWCC